MSLINQRGEELLLAGYVLLCDTGFALPCYVTHPRANAWYAAICAIEGDHGGVIAGFDLYEGGRVESLPEELYRRVQVGEPWQDVFLWKGRPHVGGAVAILDALRPEVDTLTARVPISTLDLALAADEPHVRALVETTFGYVERRHGARAAERWFHGTLLVGEVRLALRRRLAAVGADRTAFAAVRRAAVATNAGAFVATIPDAVAVALALADQLDEARRQVGLIGRRVGVDIEVLVERPSAETASPMGYGLLVEEEEEEEVGTEAVGAWDNKAWWPGTATRILIVVSGRRGLAVAKHISEPDWVPVPHAPEALRRWHVQRERPKMNRPEHEVSIIDVLDAAKLPESVEAYAAVVWLLDDPLVLDAKLSGMVERVINARRPDRSTVHLLAPALPLQRPSTVLATLASEKRVPFPCHCVIDTSLSRSPFWTGNPDRAIDRRIADISVGSALLCAIDGPIRAELLRAGPAGKRLLSVALGRGELDSHNPDLGLASEVSATGLVETGGKRLDVGFGVTPLDRTVRGRERGYASLRFVEPVFDALAEAVVTLAALSSAGKESKQPLRRKQVQLKMATAGDTEQITVRSALDMPNWSAVVRTERGASMIVTGEAPSLEAVRLSWEGGCNIVRYTDRETISELLASQRSSTLPRELSLPPLRRIESNRGLAVRGVDPRDVVRMPADVVEQWQSDWPHSGLASSARGYLSRVGTLEGSEAAFPRIEIAQAVSKGDPAAAALATAMGDRAASLLERPVKRPADLRAAWTLPGEDRRFVLEDGRLPIVMMELPAFAVPAQRMFLIDGDVAVPLLLMSRPFGIWARATTSRSMSWLSRFSVSGTFETVPIPRCLELVATPGERPRLRLARQGAMLKQLAFMLEGAVGPDGRWSRPTESRNADEDALIQVWREIDAHLLGFMDLRTGASDMEVLERMLEINVGPAQVRARMLIH